MAQELFELPDGKVVCCNPGGRFHGWLFHRHPDGQLVSVSKLPNAQVHTARHSFLPSGSPHNCAVCGFAESADLHCSNEKELQP